MRFKEEHSSFFEPTAVQPDPDIMLEVVEKFFAYAMMSHRWEDQEPLHTAQRSCRTSAVTAKERGFRWAWSDTCCIDKNSTSELQKSIISMFKWYRNSDLTIVYLCDVADSSAEALRDSVWFKRGWTLQELIAPARLLFFQKDWSLLKTSDDLPLDNYKESLPFRNWQRMSWAAHRKTTEIEDIAYCLMGIFDVHFPVMYRRGG
ncbi:hypothetical protein BU15DRAFT_89019 [Melanogaster broomeanus]|nr:hypothetical protein BU15DRAFT_89019 [Melanogaster broomeanus]